MKNKNFLILIFIFLSTTFSNSNEIEFTAKTVETKRNGNLIIGKDKAQVILNDNFEINAKKFNYNKLEKILNVSGNVLSKDKLNKVDIKSDSLIYKQVEELITYENNILINDKLNNINIITNKFTYSLNKKIITVIGKADINVDNNYKIISHNLIFDKNNNTLKSKEKSTLIDNEGNKVELFNLFYDHQNQILKGLNITVTDIDQNRYYLARGMIDLSTNELIGKDIKVILRNNTFGNPANNPRLVGRSIIYGADKTRIKKGIFTSCGINNKCPPWSIKSDEIIHDKSKKEIHYHKAWINIYDKPVLYFPKFFHPDPTVKRRSGFLTPKISNSNSLGSSIKTPYFLVISESSDLTFKPRIFSNTEYLLQSEFRKVTKNSNHIADFSINKNKLDEKEGRKTHFFSNSSFDLSNPIFDESFLDIKIEKVSNDNYTKLYSLESDSPIINDTEILESSLEFSGSNKNYDFDISIETYETMNKTNNDRYEFVYPNYSLSRFIDLNNSIFNSLELSSAGSQKKFSTNIYEGVQINDMLISTKKFITEIGINHQLKTLFKNINSEGTNSKKYKKDMQSEILSSISYDIQFPLIKELNNDKKNYLTPKISLRHSPNKTKNVTDEARTLSSSNIFNLNRLGFQDNIEGGTSVTTGIDFSHQNKEGNDFLTKKIATIFREKEDKNLPTTSTLGKKQSDIIGEIGFIPSKNFLINYNYALDNDWDQINLHNITNEFRINNFVNKFNFYEENNIVGDKSYFENSFSYLFNEKNSLSFKTRENKKDNLTEFYNLIYEYKNDCLTASIRYNKEYYKNGSLKPNEDLFFNLTLIPLGSTETESIID